MRVHILVLVYALGGGGCKDRFDDGRGDDDFGISTGSGFDIGKFSIFGFKYGFYIGMFYDYGLTEIYNDSYLKAYNRTLGLNLGVNFL
ncbi:MAG: hypothetical protein LBQ87_09945 [Candidatus Fibromonas sp.]|jgi:hypothetical protein|nr:hypothetical protein [Candidatus Fibromonas sp.]